MSQSNSCPECGKSLLLTEKDCTCGWSQKQQPVPAYSDYRCRYQLDARRCPLPGTISSSPYGIGSWYCAGHWYYLTNPSKSEAILTDAEKNYHDILQRRHESRKFISKANLNEKKKYL
jgi:hypothetical protein